MVWMVPSTSIRVTGVVSLAMVIATVIPDAASAQTDPNPGAITLTASVDFSNAYFFRGIPQDETGLVTWPAVDLGFALWSGSGGLKSVRLNVGTWNSLHTGVAGTDGPGKLWYESDFSATLGLGFGGGVALGTTYTAYTSPNGLFGSVREISIRLSVDDASRLGAVAMKPYALLAFELDGQADGGSEEGRYLELGVAPGVSARGVSLTVPVKVGLSLGDYYESARGDERFGFFSIAGVVSVPLKSVPTKVGVWNVHGGVELLRLGHRNQAFGETGVVGSVGLGFTY